MISIVAKENEKIVIDENLNSSIPRSEEHTSELQSH